MPVQFKDISKAAKDLLGKGFDSANSVKVTTSAADGVTYTAQVNAKGAGKVAGKVGAKFKLSNDINVKKLELANNGTLSATVNLVGLVDNVTFSLDSVLEPLQLSGDREKCEVGIDYTHEKARVNLSISPLLPTSASVGLLVQAHDNFVVGGSYSGQLDDTWTHSSDDVGVGYSKAGNTVTLTTGNFFQKFALAGYHKHSADIALAATVGLDRSSPSSANITVGGSYQVDADTSVKGKINVPSGSTAGAAVSFGLNQKINSNVRLTAGSKISLDPSDDLFGASFALGLELGSV